MRQIPEMACVQAGASPSRRDTATSGGIILLTSLPSSWLDGFSGRLGGYGYGYGSDRRNCGWIVFFRSLPRRQSQSRDRRNLA